MEFYLNKYLDTNGDDRVSIPNGMEFYIILQKLSLSVNLFQFPTGWNSTLLPLFRVYNFRVSIPNGMEFY